jgi:phosphonate transport system substrate-binding protein
MLFHNCMSGSETYEPTYTADTSQKKILIFGVATQAFFVIYDEFVKYLNARLKGAEVQLVGSSHFLGFVEKVENRDFTFTIGNGIQVVESAGKGYSVAARVVEEHSYSGVILVNKDSSIADFADLKNKTVATPGKPALAGHMLQMLYLGKKGLNPTRDLRLQYFESFESVYLNIYLGKCAAGFSSKASWYSFIRRRPEVASKVAVKWVTPRTLDLALLVRSDLDKSIANQLTNLILSMHSSNEGRIILAKLGYLRFERADSTYYTPMKHFLDEYEAFVGDYKQ